jgi:hypothetical protein
MSFLNLALLGGALAFCIPLAIHLLNKSRYTRIDWGAMFLLEQIVRQNRKRIRLEQIIMLLVRCAIPVLIALAMAQPVLTGWQKLIGSAPGSTVVMLDSSYSMQARDDGANLRSRYDHALEQTRAMLGAMPEGSQGQVVRVGGGFDPVTKTLTPELDRVGDKLESLSADRALADGPAALREGITQLSDAKTLKRDLVLVSDFQRVSWSEDSGFQRDRLKKLIDDMPTKPSIVLMPVVSQPGQNLSITGVTLSSRAIGVGQRIRIVCTVLNTSEEDAPDTPVVLRVDGAAQDTQRLSISAGESADLVFFHKFEVGGPHRIELSLSDGVLAADDVYRVAVNVIESLPVLLVNGDLSVNAKPKPFPENETDFLEIALAPYAASADAPLADLIKTQTIDPSQMDEVALDGQRAVVLANVPVLTNEQVKILEAFVDGGGALIIFPGDHVQTTRFNELLYRKGKGLSPAGIDALAGKGLGFDEGATLLDDRYEHPALSLWNDPSNGTLRGATFSAWYNLKPDEDVRIIARLSTGHPLLVEREFGQGVVILCATSIDSGWSDLPLKPFYMPLMQRLIAFAATHAEPESNVFTGRPLTALLSTKPDKDRLIWQTPDGEQLARPVKEHGGHWVCTLNDTAMPGYYRLLIDDEAAKVFSVNLPRDESDLRQLTDDEIQALAQSIGAKVFRDAQAYTDDAQTQRHGRPLWRLMWVLALALVFSELLLQQWFGKGGRV